VTETLFVPGRLCLFGEHSDWAGAYRTTHPALAAGRCLVAGTDQGLEAEVTCADGFELETVLPHGERRGPLRVAADVAALDAVARAGGFFSYAAGTAAETLVRHGVGGVRIRVVRHDLPVAKGLSSSAAVCVLVARALSRVHGLGLDVREEMELAYAGERRAGSQCGRMDQACAYGRRVTALEFDGAGFAIEPLAVGAPLALVVVDLGCGKDTRRILADLNACFPDGPGDVAAGVRDALGPANAALVARARRAIEAGDAPVVGALMADAQALFDARVAPACPELRAPRLHAVLAHPAVRELATGGKGVGSQGDGCAQLVARDPDARDRLTARLARELGVACHALTLG
jgi:galactokinase